MGFQVLLHLGRGDVLAAADDAVAEPAGDGHPAVLDDGEVAGSEPAVDEGVGGVIGVQIAPGQLRPGHPQLAVVVHPEPSIPERPPVGVGHPVGRVVEPGGGDRGSLGGAVGPLHRGSQSALRPAAERRGHPGAPAGDHSQRGSALRVEGVAVHEGGEQRRRPDHVGDRLSLDQLQRRRGIPAGHEHRLHAHRSRYQHPVQQPGDMGQRRRHQGAIGGGQSVSRSELADLVAQACVGVDHPPGRAGGAGCEHDRRVGVVGRRTNVAGHAGRRCARVAGHVGGRYARVVPRIGGALGRELVHRRRVDGAGIRIVGSGDSDDGSGLGQCPAQVMRAGRRMQPHRHRPDTPAGPVGHHAVDADRKPERDPVALPDAASGQRARHRLDSVLDVGGGEPAVVIHDEVVAGRRRGQQGVQGHWRPPVPSARTWTIRAGTKLSTFWPSEAQYPHQFGSLAGGFILSRRGRSGCRR